MSNSVPIKRSMSVSGNKLRVRYSVYGDTGNVHSSSLPTNFQSKRKVSMEKFRVYDKSGSPTQSPRSELDSLNEKNY